MFKVASNEEVGSYLKQKIEEKYGRVRRFCREYLRLQESESKEITDVEITDEEIRKLQNRFSQILKGKKAIQTYDLQFVTELLSASCEEILSAGKCFVPTSGHVTNYDIAFSHEREVWDHYMNREDKLFLNADEYCKTVIDYALEFKNYDFIKYLLEDGFIWFVDPSGESATIDSFGAGTKIQRRQIGEIDYDTQRQLTFGDDLRQRVLALAIEKGDFDILDRMKARMLPGMEYINYEGIGYPGDPKKPVTLLQILAKTRNAKVLDYFSSEYTIQSLNEKHENVFVYPYLSSLLDELLKYNQNDLVNIVLEKAIKHNQSTLDKLTALVKEAYENRLAQIMTGPNEIIVESVKERCMKAATDFLRVDQKNHLLFYFYVGDSKMTKGFITNLVKVTYPSVAAEWKEKVDKLNQIYEKIIKIREGKIDD